MGAPANSSCWAYKAITHSGKDVYPANRSIPVNHAVTQDTVHTAQNLFTKYTRMSPLAYNIDGWKVLIIVKGTISLDFLNYILIV